MPTDLQMLGRLLLTLFLSGLIGLERQVHRRDAGLRTHILVALGSCLIMLTSLYVFDIYKAQVSLDPARIAAGVRIEAIDLEGAHILGAGGCWEHLAVLVDLGIGGKGKLNHGL